MSCTTTGVGVVVEYRWYDGQRRATEPGRSLTGSRVVSAAAAVALSYMGVARGGGPGSGRAKSMRPLAPPRRPRGNPPGNQATVARATKLSSARWRAGRPGTVAADRSGVLGEGEEGRTRDPGGSLHTSVAAAVRGACALPSPPRHSHTEGSARSVFARYLPLQTPGSRKTCSAERQQTRVVTRPPRGSFNVRVQN